VDVVGDAGAADDNAAKLDDFGSEDNDCHLLVVIGKSP
jgi:hypothetical protein